MPQSLLQPVKGWLSQDINEAQFVNASGEVRWFNYEELWSNKSQMNDVFI